MLLDRLGGLAACASAATTATTQTGQHRAIECLNGRNDGRRCLLGLWRQAPARRLGLDEIGLHSGGDLAGREGIRDRCQARALRARQGQPYLGGALLGVGDHCRQAAVLGREHPAQFILDRGDGAVPCRRESLPHLLAALRNGGDGLLIGGVYALHRLLEGRVTRRRSFGEGHP